MSAGTTGSSDSRATLRVLTIMFGKDGHHQATKLMRLAPRTRSRYQRPPRLSARLHSVNFYCHRFMPT